MDNIADKYRSFPFHLRSAVWEITLACCFKCAYCGSCAGGARENELTAEECDSVAAQLAMMGCRRVSLIGGEVFMRPDWRSVVSSLTSRGIKTCIITNGFRMTDPILTALKELDVESVAVSLDGVRELHDAFRQSGSFDRAVDAISAVAGAGIPVSIISTLRSDNAPRLEEFYEMVKDLPVFAWQIQACSPMGNARKNKLDVAFDAAGVIKFVKRIAKTAPFTVGVADNIGYFTPEEGGIRGRNGAVFGGCSAGLETVGIDSTGNVRGCESLYDERFNEGNLRERSLMDIWTDENAFAYNRRFTPELLTGKCASCPYGAVCAGGCRSYDWFSSGKLYENPLCARGK